MPNDVMTLMKELPAYLNAVKFVLENAPDIDVETIYCSLPLVLFVLGRMWNEFADFQYNGRKARLAVDLLSEMRSCKAWQTV